MEFLLNVLVTMISAKMLTSFTLCRELVEMRQNSLQWTQSLVNLIVQ